MLSGCVSHVSTFEPLDRFLRNLVWALRDLKVHQPPTSYFPALISNNVVGAELRDRSGTYCRLLKWCNGFSKSVPTLWTRSCIKFFLVVFIGITAVCVVGPEHVKFWQIVKCSLSALHLWNSPWGPEERLKLASTNPLYLLLPPPPHLSIRSPKPRSYVHWVTN
jgi:hypothetical protein